MPKFKLTKKQFGILVVTLSLGFGVLAYLLRDEIIRFQNLGYFGVFIINLVGSATIVLPTPTLISTIAVGALLNPLLTGIFSAMGSTIGELTGYFAGRGGEELIRKDKNIQKVQKWMDKYGLWVVFVLAFIPNPIFDIAGMVSGASKIPIRRYLIVVFAGKLIKFIFLAYIGFGFLKISNI